MNPWKITSEIFKTSSQNYLFYTVHSERLDSDRPEHMKWHYVQMNLTKSVYVILIQFSNEFHKYIFELCM